MTPEQITELIEQYGRPAFELAMRQVYINAALSAAWGVGLLAATAIGAIVTVKLVNDWMAERVRGGYYSGNKDIAAFLTGGATALAGGLALLVLSGLTSLLNPEYAALRLLMSGVA